MASAKPALPSFDGVARNALVVIAVVIGGAALKWLGDILTPLFLAIFLAVMVDGFARLMKERLPWMPDAAAVPVAIAVSVLIFGVSAVVIAANASSFKDQLTGYTPRMNSLIAELAAQVGYQAAPTLQQMVQRLNPGEQIGNVASGLAGFASDAFFVLIYLAFIIASRNGFRRKLVALFPRHVERDEAMATFQSIRVGVEQYLWVQTVTGLMIAAASGVIMMLVGLDNVLFWTFLIFLASYVPIIGGVIGVMLPAAFALLQFPTWWQGAALLIGLQAVQFVVGNFVLPKMQGDTLNMDPVVVLLSLAFWGAIWGMTGMFLSTPLTVMAMVILAQFPGSRWIAILLSANGNPHTPEPHIAMGKDG